MTQQIDSQLHNNHNQHNSSNHNNNNNINDNMFDNSISNVQYSHISGIELYNSIVQQQSQYQHVYDALHLVIDCIYKYSIEHLAFSFNGGKDCTVILHLLRAACAYLDISLNNLLTIYFKVDYEFSEIEQFMLYCQKLYNLQFVEVKGEFKLSLHNIFTQRKTNNQPVLKAIFMGQRQHDPYCNKLQTISMTDSTWPPFDRLNICIDWSYQQIWSFLIDFKLIYCKLYDIGYTSIGNIYDSVQNPALYDNSTQQYLPAYKLTDETLERKGRIEKKKYTENNSAQTINHT